MSGLNALSSNSAQGAAVESLRHEVSPYRPIQYLGNKLRVLDGIGSAASELVGSGSTVADLFSGTSLVAQEFSRRGFRVTATDSQRYAECLAQALLGVRRSPFEELPVNEVLAEESPWVGGQVSESWTPSLVAETELLKAQDYGGLTALYAQLPVDWRLGIGQRTQSGNIETVATKPLITSLYAGTYFGVLQALEIDRIRLAIERLAGRGRVSEWQFSGLLSALMAAASASVHSAGKHFAQPLSAGNSGNLEFLSRRLIRDRSISVESEFAKAAKQIATHAAPADFGHWVAKLTAEEFASNPPFPVDLYYLDPPYTAQQYSRFYHILETLCDYRWPNLLHNGQVTTGLYPTDRFKSAFSSRQAITSFKTIVSAAKCQGAALMISYSASSGESTGNARMISLDALLEICRREYGQHAVTVCRMSHRYRQFNSASNSSKTRDDPEVLIQCKR